jgi:hypothetical protein
MVVSIFGESDEDRRDYMMGLAGFLAGIHSLRILAEKGIATPADIMVAKDGIEGILDRIPASQVDSQSMERLKDMLLKIQIAAGHAQLDGKKG